MECEVCGSEEERLEEDRRKGNDGELHTFYVCRRCKNLPDKTFWEVYRDDLIMERLSGSEEGKELLRKFMIVLDFAKHEMDAYDEIPAEVEEVEIYTVGNFLDVKEAIDRLNNMESRDLRELGEALLVEAGWKKLNPEGGSN